MGDETPIESICLQYNRLWGGVMEPGKRYKVFAADGLPYGYFLDGRLYEYLTSTCVGSLNDQLQLVDADQRLLGGVENGQFKSSDGAIYTISEEANPQ